MAFHSPTPLSSISTRSLRVSVTNVHNSRSALYVPEIGHSPQRFIINRYKKTSVFSQIVDGWIKPELDRRQKILWILALLISGMICLGQLSDRLYHYFSHPIVTDVAIENIGTVTFPPVMLCKTDFASNFLEGLEKILTENCSNTENCSAHDWELFTFDQLGLDLIKTWDQFSLRPWNVRSSMSCIGLYDKSICKQRKGLNINKTDMDTFHGRCITYSSGDVIEIHGPSTYWTFKVDNHVNAELMEFENDEESDIMLYIHGGKITQNYEVFFFARELVRKFKSNVYINSKTFHFLNTTKNRCFHEETYSACKSNCYLEKMKRNTKCRLPFMELQMLPMCWNYNSTYDAIFAARDTYSFTKSTDCQCYRICNETKYLTLIDVIPVSLEGENLTEFKIYFTDGMKEVITEKYLYSFSALLSDVAGNLGFFLGLSVLAGLEFAAKTVLKTYHYFSKKCA